MQKIKEWIEKDKNAEELIPDLSKTFNKSIPKQLEILLELLDYKPT